MATKTKPGETRGRPKKEDSRTLPTISKRLFPEDLAVVSACCLIYVFEIFVDTRKERRVGHKDGGFTMFQKLSSQYSFDSYQNDLKEWDCDDLLKIESMQPFLLQLPGLGPKPILKQLTIFIMSILKQHIQEGKAEEQIEHELLDSEVVASDYPNMRFVPETLLNLKLDKGGVQDYEERVEAKVNELWPSFVRIMVYTVINSYKAISYNKYFKPFFSDAPNPQQTHIGQLNLTQIVTTVERQEENQRLKNGNFPLEIKKPRNERILVIVDAKKENEQKNEVKQEDKIKQQWERQNQMLEGKRQREQEDKIEPRPRKISPLLVEANNFHLFKSQKNQEV